MRNIKTVVKITNYFTQKKLLTIQIVENILYDDYFLLLPDFHNVDV